MTVKDFDLRAALMRNRDAGSEHPKCQLWYHFGNTLSPNFVWAKGPWLTRVKMAYYAVASEISDNIIT